ncbi:DUF1700 domain-containing protein [Companilactobacillus kimchiensis]|uniref:DUF1700 domain-containing protein n=1 Tax=Companilactobacillus kimchiensis TaxID=993692 RepID=A0A0R2LGX1_9LACO|nr:DUF1700 domain-containing protein [Companilactobacillus kimchiensis]KRN99286.1 hypothetical protein IV57_GL000342 [Companilactobacillus kimchiensis]
MDKTDFLVDLQKRLKKYGVRNANDYIDYYSEYLDDLIENGMNAGEAISNIGGVEKVVLHILSDEDVEIPETKNRIKSTLFLTIALPIWGPILMAGYIILLAAIFAFFICTIAFIVSGLWIFLGSFVVIFKIGWTYALLQFGMSLILLGLGIICEQGLLGSSNGLFRSSKYLFKTFNKRGV